jgi:hypothetical protein
MLKIKSSIKLRNQKDIVVYLDKENTMLMLNQFYDLCSGELTDNCFEISIPTEASRVNDCILIKADEILSVQSESIHEE